MRSREKENRDKRSIRWSLGECGRLEFRQERGIRKGGREEWSVTYQELWANDNTTEEQGRGCVEAVVPGSVKCYREGKEDRNKCHMGNMKKVDLDKSPFRQQGEFINQTVVGEQEDKREGIGGRNRSLAKTEG